MLAENFLFLRPEWLWGLLLIAGIALFRSRRQHNNQKQPLIAAHLSQNLVHYAMQNKMQYYFLYPLVILTLIALAGPSWQKVSSPVYNLKKAQVLIMDMSYSMYATDIKPDRLSQAKYKAIDLIKSWDEGEKALVAYAGEAFTLSPLTSDSNAILNHIPNLKPEIMPVMGSNADAALKKAITLLKNAGYTKGHIVFITDDISQAQADKMLARLQGTPWVVSILAVATEQGSPITLSNGQLLSDKKGNIVIATLHKSPLLEITNATHGLYLAFQNNNQDVLQLASFFTQQSAQKNNATSQRHQRAKDAGYWFIFIIAGLFLGLFRKGFLYLLMFCVVLPLSSGNVEASIWKNTQQNAYQAYQNKDYKHATELYKNSFDKGSALYKNKQYKKALNAFTQAVQQSPKNAQALYNQANSYAKLGKLDKAIETYQQALTLKKDFTQARNNKKLLENLKKQAQQKKKEQSKKNKKGSKKQQSNKNNDSSNAKQPNQKQKQKQHKSNTSKKDNKSKATQAEKNNSINHKAQKNKDNTAKQNQTSQKKSSLKKKNASEKNKKMKANTASKRIQKHNKKTPEKAQKTQKTQKSISANKSNNKTNKEYQALPNWLKNMPDDPSLLLQNKMRLEYQKRALSQPVQSQNNGIIW